MNFYWSSQALDKVYRPFHIISVISDAQETTRVHFHKQSDLHISLLQGCRQLVGWSNGVEKELKPHIVGTAVVGLVGKLAMHKAGKSVVAEGGGEEKRRAFIVRMRRRLTDCQSELPLRRQQLTRLQSQAQQLKSETMERKAIPGELNQADKALGKAADILARLEIQVNIEEKRQVCGPLCICLQIAYHNCLY